MCWTCLDLAKRQNLLRQPEEKDGHDFPNSMALYNMGGVPLPEPARTRAVVPSKDASRSPSEPQASSTACGRPSGLAGERTERGTAFAHSVEGLGNMQRVDSLATAMAASLRYHEGPDAFKTALLPDGARPSLWGFPASFLVDNCSARDAPLPALQNSEKW
ncbi:hypothetical protein ACSSS7_006299 [Eimeria intestinalis]